MSSDHSSSTTQPNLGRVEFDPSVLRLGERNFARPEPYVFNPEAEERLPYGTRVAVWVPPKL